MRKDRNIGKESGSGMKLLVLSACMMLSLLPLRSQNSSPIFTQQLFSQVNFNPAAIVQNPLVEASLYGRAQWMGFKGAPKDIMLNVSGYLPEIKSGISGSVIGESFGPTFMLNAKVGYSYHIHMGRKNYLTFGLNVGFIFKNFAAEKMVAEDGSDPYLEYENLNDVKPDVDFGLMFTFNKFQLGLSATHLTAWAYNREKDYFAPQEAYHAFIRFQGDINSKFALDPYIAAYYSNGFFKAEAILNFRILNLFWFGGGYRYNDAVVMMAGVKIGKVFTLGYAYDMSMGSLRKWNSGSHEVFLSLRIETTRKVGEVTDTPLMFE